MTPLQIVRKFWPSVRLSLTADGRLVIRDPAGRTDVVKWIAEHEEEILKERRLEKGSKA